VNGEKFWDELWIGVKVLPNLSISGSRRNVFRDSVVLRLAGVELLIGMGGSNPTPPNQTSNTTGGITAVSPWGISSLDERETAQIAS
jgi:hypothetical protein